MRKIKPKTYLISFVLNIFFSENYYLKVSIYCFLFKERGKGEHRKNLHLESAQSNAVKINGRTIEN